MRSRTRSVRAGPHPGRRYAAACRLRRRTGRGRNEEERRREQEDEEPVRERAGEEAASDRRVLLDDVEAPGRATRAGYAPPRCACGEPAPAPARARTGREQEAPSSRR